MSILYETIARLCMEQHISIAALCRKAHVSPGIISDLKTGRKKTLTMETVTKLARALGVSADILTGDTTATSAQRDAFIAFYGEVKDFLDDDDKNDLIAFMRMKAELKRYDQDRENRTRTR